MSTIKLFNRWDTSGIKIQDPGLVGYVNLRPIIIPRTCGRNVKTQFWKSKNHIVERLINKIMIPGHKGKKHKFTSGRCTGKAITAYKITENVLLALEQKTKKNPVEVLVRAIENAAPREEITTIEYGGARYPKAVECAPQRRVDFALRLMIQGAYAASFAKKRSFHYTLTDEIFKAYQCDQGSTAINKKLEVERQADASR
ncbi:MAG TPA: 30S ribosomal protein S7 [Candidatus Nanoarchaeia archaeon]|nr:30S ribosomal protein S7 [Candidatus Nanoarchaeia archaeon]